MALRLVRRTRDRGQDAALVGARPRVARERPERVFRTIFGAELRRNTVIVDGRHEAGGDDLFRRPWFVVCADRGGAARR